MFRALARAVLLPLSMCAVFASPAVQAESAQLSGPLTVVVGYAPGGATDRAARIVAQGLQDKLGVSVVVENKTGAGGRIAADYVKAANAGANILLLGNPAVMVVAPLVYDNLNYDPDKDFKAVSMVTEYGFGVAVQDTSPLKSLRALIEWARANPDKFNVGVPATGSLPHFFALMLADDVGVKAEVIGYRGSAPLLTDLIGGVVPVAIDTLDTLIQQHQGKRIRILATSGVEREKDLPEVPTFKEEGVDLVASGWNAFFAAASMSDDKVKMLGKAISETVALPQVQTALLQSGLIPVEADAGRTAGLIADFRSQWEPAIKRSGYVVNK